MWTTWKKGHTHTGTLISETATRDEEDSELTLVLCKQECRNVNLNYLKIKKELSGGLCDGTDDIRTSKGAIFAEMGSVS